MTTNPSVEFVTRVFRERQSSLVSLANSLLDEMAGNDPDTKHKSAQNLQQEIVNLLGMLPTQDAPAWLRDLQHITELFILNRLTAAEFMRKFVLLKQTLRNAKTALISP